MRACVCVCGRVCLCLCVQIRSDLLEDWRDEMSERKSSSDRRREVDEEVCVHCVTRTSSCRPYQSMRQWMPA